MINDERNNYYYFAIKNLSELNSLGCLRSKKEAIINNNNNNNNNSSRDFQNASDDALNYQAIKTNPERISKLKPYIDKYNWKRIDFPAGPKDWIKFERDNKTIALNVLYIPCNTQTISVAYRSEYNNNRKKQVILLVITDGKKSHYLAAALLQKKFIKSPWRFLLFKLFQFIYIKKKLKEHEEICNNHDSCRMEMPSGLKKY